MVNPAKAAVSNAYMDANGIGKVITISEAVFQALPQNASNITCGGTSNLPGGCACSRYDDAHVRFVDNREPELLLCGMPCDVIV